MNKQTLKTLMPSMLSLMFITILLISVSIAWFSMNREVNSNGLQINVEASPNLIIAKTEEAIRRVTQETGANAFAINYSDPLVARQNMAPATAAVDANNEWVTAIAEEGDNVTGLKYVKNTNDIDFSSGIAKNGKELQFKPVPVDSNSKYYIDYDIYIASLGKELEASSLTAKISCESEIGSHQAATIVFYQGSVSSANMKGAISVANKESGIVYFDLNNGIPLNTDDPIHIIARCYFDGALLNEDTGNAYINSATVDTTDVILNITFTAAVPDEN
ncbi:MAG: hypothetical protein ACOX3X_05185 [Eubacteriales bacterium]|jgi:hypothetical protein